MNNLFAAFAPMISDRSPSNFFRGIAPWLMHDGLRDATITQSETGYAIEVDVPGVEKDALAIELDGETLSITTKENNAVPGATKDEDKTDGAERERTYNFRFRVPADVDAAAMKAVLKNGVLKVDLPKSEVKQPKKIPVLAE